jgi:hypothetical protein
MTRTEIAQRVLGKVLKIGSTTALSVDTQTVYQAIDLRLKSMHQLGIFWRKVDAVPFTFSASALICWPFDIAGAAAAETLFDRKEERVACSVGAPAVLALLLLRLLLLLVVPAFPHLGGVAAVLLVVGAALLYALETLSDRSRAVLAIALAGLSLMLVNLAPDDRYFESTLQSARAGQLINLHGVLSGVAMVWPLAAIAWFWRRTRTRRPGGR